jgi:hypothetical protein
MRKSLRLGNPDKFSDWCALVFSGAHSAIDDDSFRDFGVAQALKRCRLMFSNGSAVTVALTFPALANSRLSFRSRRVPTIEPRMVIPFRTMLKIETGKSPGWGQAVQHHGASAAYHTDGLFKSLSRNSRDQNFVSAADLFLDEGYGLGG